MSKAGPAKVTKFQGEQYFSLREFQNNTFDIIRKFEKKNLSGNLDDKKTTYFCTAILSKCFPCSVIISDLCAKYKPSSP